MPIAERFGLWAAFAVCLVVSVLAFAWKREQRMAKRIDTLEDESHKASLNVATALNNNGEILKQVVRLQEDNLKELRKLNVEMRCRPCLQKETN